jgi:hypothetical protein
MRINAVLLRTSTVAALAGVGLAPLLSQGSGSKDSTSEVISRVVAAIAARPDTSDLI